MLLRAPGVQQDDTGLLVEALHAASVPERARVLDIGTGALALEAMRAGAAEVTAVDISWRALWTARASAWVYRRAPVRVRQGDAVDAVPGLKFDLVLSDGSQLVDRLCDRVFGLLAVGGTLLTVHSALCGVDSTLRRLRDCGLKASVVLRRRADLVVIRADRHANSVST